MPLESSCIHAFPCVSVHRPTPGLAYNDSGWLSDRDEDELTSHPITSKLVLL